MLADKGFYRSFAKLKTDILASRDRAALANPVESGFDTQNPTVTQSGTAPAGLTKTYNPGGSIGTSPVNFFGGFEVYAGFGSFSRAPIGSGYAAPRYEIAFDGTEIGFLLEAGSNAAAKKFRLVIDGRYIEEAGVPKIYDTADGVYVRITFASRRRHKIGIERQVSQTGLGTIYLEPTGQASRTYEDTAQLKAFVVGDSYVSATGPSFYHDTWANILGYTMGWNVFSEGIGGSGYANTSFAQFDHPSRLEKLALHPMDIVVVAGSINDTGSTFSPQVQARAQSTWAAQRAIQPNALFIVVGVQSGGTGPSAIDNSTIQTETRLKAAFDSWADPYSIFVPWSSDPQPINFGTGRVGATNGNGNNDIYVWNTDSTHLNSLGHKEAAEPRIRNSILKQVRALAA